MGWRTRRRSGLQTQMREDLLDHWLLHDRRDDLQLAAAVRAVRHVDLEHALQQLGPAQPNRTVVRTGRFALDRRCGLRGWFEFLRHHQRAQLGVGCQNAMEANQASSVGAGTSTKTGSPSVSPRYTPSSTRQ